MTVNASNEESYQYNRVHLATSCNDCSGIPKVNGAGSFFGLENEYQIMHNGVLVKRGSYHGEWMSEIISKLKGHHEPQEEKVFSEVLKTLCPGAVMIELGSFWAYYSLWFQQSISNAKSILIEPNAKKLAIGKEHFELNKMQGTFIRGFVGASAKQSAEFVDWDGSKSLISRVSVDELLAEFEVTSLDILHADVQGAEFDMLRGATKSLEAGRIKYLFISTHGCEHRRCIRYLKKYNYQIVVEHSILESFSGDGLIVAQSPALPLLRINISRNPCSLLARIRQHLACFKRIFLYE
jgi:FkbM family methyltransferase